MRKESSSIFLFLNIMQTMAIIYRYFFFQLGMVVHACNFRTREVAEESAGVRVHIEFEASLDYINKYIYFLE